MVFFLTRGPGTLSILEESAQTLLRRWVPKWHEVFADTQTPLFYERVGHAFKPMLTGRRRLLSQLRQLAMYCHAAGQPETFMFHPDLQKHADAILQLFRGDDAGAWIFSIGDDLAPQDKSVDLYTMAFVIFAMAHYGRATNDPRARDVAMAAARFIDTRMRLEHGFAENIGGETTLRRHESHMHLLEACLDAVVTFDAALFMRLADELTQLFTERLYDRKNALLSEYFTDALAPAPDAQSGKITCEAGHYYEWIWLLKKHARLSGAPSRHDGVCLELLAWANAHGWDTQYGGIYDEVEPDGTIISDKKRIWPLTEALKANALLMDIAPDRDALKNHMAAMARLLKTSYIQKRGFWSEWLARDLAPQTDYMPATTPYHVYFGIMEARAALRARGTSKSWRMGPRNVAYAATRKASAVARSLRFMLKALRPARD